MKRNKLKLIILLLAMAVATAMANTPTGGGAVGVNFGTIENGYSTGFVFGSANNIGGLVGQNQSGTIINSFFDSQRSGRNDNDGRGVPLTTAQMRQRTTFAHWDIENIWGMDALMYNGEPFLRTFYPLSRAKFTIDGQRTAVSPAPANLISSAMPYTGIMLHTGGAITPTVQIEHNGQPLTLDIDFQLEFERNINVSPNNNPARMRIIGMGNYEGTTIGYNFFITNTGRAITSATFVPNSIPQQLHTGAPIEPEIEIRDFGGAVVLQNGVDYILGYGANNTIGTNAGSVSITGMGLFTGNRVMNFNIVAAHSIQNITTTPATLPAVTFNGERHTPTLTVRHNTEGDLQEGRDFTLTWGGNVDAGTNVGQAIITGIGSFTGTVTRAFTINWRDINDVAIMDIPPQQFTEEPITPLLTITDGGRTLALGTDYTVQYFSNVNPGTNAQAVVTGIGNYTGTRPVLFTIGEIERTDVPVIWREPLSFVFNGREQHPTATAT
ncbi:MAG: hypothetical protein FWE23_11315, partial [Chitinivibrionia bacterium]|nr:hypothetical protein [Chitinivibrionia bacterium]